MQDGNTGLHVQGTVTHLSLLSIHTSCRPLSAIWPVGLSFLPFWT